MRHYKTVQCVVEKRIHTKATCDKCDSIIPEPKGCYDTREFSLEMLKGESYPGGGYHEGWEVDLCDTCVSWLVDILQKSGVVLQKVENDW